MTDQRCKKCGIAVKEHDDVFCKSHKYPALMREFDHLLPVAKLYKIDLTKANEKNAIDGVCGDCDLWLDVVGSIHSYIVKSHPERHPTNIVDYVMENMYNWDYTSYDDWEEQKPKILEVLSQ